MACSHTTARRRPPGDLPTSPARLAASGCESCREAALVSQARTGRCQRNRRQGCTLTEPTWDLPLPYAVTLRVVSSDIDAYGHANNAVYVRWLDQAAWSHSADLDLPVERCLALDRGMVVVRTNLAYHQPAFDTDVLLIGTWLTPGASRLRVGRRFQIVRASDGSTLARATIEYACVELSTGRPARWPTEFTRSYRPLPTTLTLLPSLPPI